MIKLVEILGPLPRMLCYVVLALVFAGCAQSSTDQQYGRQVAAKYSFSGDELRAFNEFIEMKRAALPTQTEQSEAKQWQGPVLQVDRENGPYTVVVRLKAKSRYRGDIASMWNVGWSVDGGIRTSAFPGLSKLDVEGDKTYVLEKSVAPVRFGESKTVALVLELTKAENFDLEAVEIEVWNGVAAYSWTELLFAMRWLALALVLLLLRYFWVRRSN